MRKALATVVLALGIGGGFMAHHLTSSAPASTGCGVERWSIKTGSDAGVSAVDLTRSTWASVHSLSDQPQPATLPASSRIAPVETTQYHLTVTLVRFKAEADSDVHLIIQGAAGRQMIAEIPSPSCLSSPDPFASRITATRGTFDAHYSPSGSWQSVNIPIKLSGIGYFDFPHGQSGHAPNYVEIHPVLSIQFLAPTVRYPPHNLGNSPALNGKPGTD